MNRRLLHILPVVLTAVGAAAVCLHFAGSTAVESINLMESSSITLEPGEIREITYRYAPASAKLRAFTVDCSDLLTASAAAVSAEDGTLVVSVRAGDSGLAELVISSDAGESAPCSIAVGEFPEARLSGPPPKEDDAEDGVEGTAPQPVFDELSAVYITATGKRWHVSPSCGGENAYPVTPGEVGERTPCQRCAAAYVTDPAE